MACGEIGLTIKQFDALTFRQFDNICKGYYQKLERHDQQQWMQTRLLMYASLVPHQKKGSDLKPEDVLTLPWDVQTTPQTQLNEAEAIAQIEKQKQYWQDQDQKRKTIDG